MQRRLSMSKIVILTDSNSGISLKEAQEIGAHLVSMPFIINGEEFIEEVSLSQEDFYEKLKTKANISTSQPSSYSIMETWDELLKTYDEIIYIPMSSGLSATCSNAISLSKQEKYLNKVFVVDNQRISITQKSSTYEAIELVKEGKTSQEIITYLMDSKMKSSIYIMVNTLEYLKKGGRITPAAAALGTLLNIKPVLQIHGEKLDSFCKVLSTRVARIKMINAIKKDLEGPFKEEYEKGNMIISIAHTDNLKEALDFKKQIQEEFPNIKIPFVDPLSLSVSCHIGPGSLAIATMPNINNAIK